MRTIFGVAAIAVGVLSACATSNVAWDETQAAKAGSIRQISQNLRYPQRVAEVLRVLGTPPIRSSQAWNDPSLREQGTREERNRLAQIFGYLTVLAYYTGPQEVTRILVIGNVAIGSDAVAVPQIIWAEQGPWLPPSKAAGLFPGAPIESASGLGKPMVTENSTESQYLWSDDSSNELIAATAPHNTGHFSRVVTMRFGNLRQVRGRPDVSAAVASTVNNAAGKMEAVFAGLDLDQVLRLQGWDPQAARKKFGLQ